MSFNIKVEYETGDSFHTEDTETILESWNSLDIAKENLVRIKEHYEWSKAYGDKPKWVKPYMPIGNSNMSSYYIALLNDDREEYHVCASWCGYFETLYGASIVQSEEDGWSFRL